MYRLVLIGLVINFLTGCSPSVEKIENERIEQTQKIIDSFVPEGNYSSRYRVIHKMPTTQLCEAVLPLQRLEHIFIPMLDPAGIIRWKKRQFPSVLRADSTSNVNIVLTRLYNELTNETRKCSKAASRLYGSKPWEDRSCGAKAVKVVCGDEFVSEENYERLLKINKERDLYRDAVISRKVDAVMRSTRSERMQNRVGAISCVGNTSYGSTIVNCY